MEIKLGGIKGGIALVSKEDYDELSKYAWHQTDTGYAMGTINNILKYMHRVIKNEPKGKVVDHINENRLDNRRENLRILTRSKNGENKRKQENTTSKYYGVCFKKDKKKYEVTIRHDNEPRYLGSFINEIDAAEYRDMYIVHNNLENFKLNFPLFKRKILN